MAKILTVNIASVIQEGEWTGSEGRTGIDKRPVSGEIRFENEGVFGDSVIDRNHHGGYDQAVYAYAREDSDWWQQEIGRELNNGAFGENLTTEGIDVNESLIGERWQIGTVLLEVSQPRIPCRVFAGFWREPSLIKKFTEAKRPGAYLRIIEEGTIKAGDELKVVSRPNHLISIRDLFEAKSGARNKIAEIKQVPQLSLKYKEWISKIEN